MFDIVEVRFKNNRKIIICKEEEIEKVPKEEIDYIYNKDENKKRKVINLFKIRKIISVKIIKPIIIYKINFLFIYSSCVISFQLYLKYGQIYYIYKKLFLNY